MAISGTSSANNLEGTSGGSGIVSQNSPANQANMVTSTSSGGAFGSPALSVPQLNVSPLAAYWNQAAASTQTGDLQGLNYYAQALSTAGQQIQSGYTNANNILQPLSDQGTQAFNQLMNMSGLGSQGMNFNNSQFLQSTPGYQFALNQGQQQINRSAAASHMLGSSNTQLALQQQGQGMANSTFNNYMSTLEGIANYGGAYTSQLASNQIGLGNAQAQLSSELGQASASTYENIGQANALAATTQGNMEYNAAMYNTQTIDQRENQIIAGSSGASNAAISGAGNMMAAQNGANQLAYSVFNGQQGGQAFAQANANSGAANYGMYGAGSTIGGTSDAIQFQNGMSVSGGTV